MMEKTMERTKSKFGWIISLLILLGLAGFAKADLVGLWQFEEGTGTQAADTSGYDHHGVLEAGVDGVVGGTPTPSTEPTWITGKNGNYALLFGTPASGLPTLVNADRNWNHVKVDFSTVLANLGGSNWTMAAWVRHDQNLNGINVESSWARVMSCPSYEVELGQSADPTDYFWHWTNGSWQFGMGTTHSPLGEWYHLALTYDGTTFTKYIDGSPVFTKPVATPLPDNWSGQPGRPLRFGAQSFPDKSYLIGALDDVALFNETLTQTEIQAIMTGNFNGPWDPPVADPETSPGGYDSYLYNPTFIFEYSANQLSIGEHWRNHGPWNWEVTGVKDNTDYFGVANVSAWDGGDLSVTKYAAFVTLGDIVVQRAIWRPISPNTRYTLSAQVAGGDGGGVGTSAVGNVVGVKFYRQSNPDDPNTAVLIQNVSTTITADQDWSDLSYEYVSDPGHGGQYFRAECYIEQGTGGARGQAFGYFDEVIIALVEPLDCAAAIDLGFQPALDLTDDCFVNLDDFSLLSNEWQTSNDVEPMEYAGELFTNWSFYGDAVSVPNVGDYIDQGVPTGWSITNSSGNVYGYQNLATTGMVNAVNNGEWEAAGGTVAVYLDTNAALSQTVTSETIQNGQTYYLSAMVSGDFTAYANNFPAGNLIEVIFEAVNNPTTPTVIENIATLQFASPQERVWRRLTHVHTGIAATAGKYLRVRVTHTPVDGLTFDAANPYIWVGNVSATKTRPSDWPGTNLLTNGNFEDVSNYDQDDQIALLGSRNGYITHSFAADAPVGWTYAPLVTSGDWWNGMQSMMWAPSPQPSQGRVSIGLNGSTPGGTVNPSQSSHITQRVEATPIANTTYYLASVTSMSASNYNNGTWTLPEDAEITVRVYWYDPASPSTLNLITSLVTVPDNGLGSAGGHWQTNQISFVPPAPAIGKRFYVDGFGTYKYSYFDDIYLSTTAWPEISPYTCAQFVNEGGTMAQTDFNQDCVVDIDDFTALAEAWLDCTDPAVTGCEHGWLP